MPACRSLSSAPQKAGLKTAFCSTVAAILVNFGYTRISDTPFNLLEQVNRAGQFGINAGSWQPYVNTLFV